MYDAVKSMLSKYACYSEQDYLNALKEIFQEISLLGLWRAKFFEKAAFYGGTALRILYGLNRFSEDLDFSLLKPNKKFDLTPYNHAIRDELQSFGFEVTVETKIKNKASAIASAFIKAETLKQLITIQAPLTITNKIHRMNTLKIKMEVDTQPPGKFKTEAKTLLQPIPFSVKTFTLPDLFAGKIHAILCRPWQTRVKGRDWYDLLWYISHGVPVNRIHLRVRLIQSKKWERKKPLTLEKLKRMLFEKISNTDFNNAKNDVSSFVVDKHALSLWSKDFFWTMTERIQG